MKKNLNLIIAAVIVCMGVQVTAQDFTAKLNEAQSAYKSGDLENARFVLQQAMSDIDQAIGKEVLAAMPTSIGGMGVIKERDNVTGTGMGIAGLYVNRYYGDTTKNASVEIVSDSPMITALNAMLAMPAIMNTADPNQKRIKIAGYKAMMQKSTDDSGDVSYNIQMPFNTSLLTFRCEGINSESEVISLVNSLPIDKIVKTAQ
jgi:hypothetical protein